MLLVPTRTGSFLSFCLRSVLSSSRRFTCNEPIRTIPYLSISTIVCIRFFPCRIPRSPSAGKRPRFPCNKGEARTTSKNQHYIDHRHHIHIVELFQSMRYLPFHNFFLNQSSEENLYGNNCRYQSYCKSNCRGFHGKGQASHYLACISTFSSPIDAKVIIIPITVPSSPI